MEILGVPEFLEDLDVTQTGLSCHTNQMVAQSNRLSRQGAAGIFLILRRNQRRPADQRHDLGGKKITVAAALSSNSIETSLLIWIRLRSGK